jgi:hypothetical protein
MQCLYITLTKLPLSPSKMRWKRQKLFYASIGDTVSGNGNTLKKYISCYFVLTTRRIISSIMKKLRKLGSPLTKELVDERR